MVVFYATVLRQRETAAKVAAGEDFRVFVEDNYNLI